MVCATAGRASPVRQRPRRTRRPGPWPVAAWPVRSAGESRTCDHRLPSADMRSGGRRTNASRLTCRVVPCGGRTLTSWFRSSDSVSSGPSSTRSGASAAFPADSSGGVSPALNVQSVRSRWQAPAPSSASRRAIEPAFQGTQRRDFRTRFPDTLDEHLSRPRRRARSHRDPAAH